MKWPREIAVKIFRRAAVCMYYGLASSPSEALERAFPGQMVNGRWLPFGRPTPLEFYEVLSLFEPSRENVRWNDGDEREWHVLALLLCADMVEGGDE